MSGADRRRACCACSTPAPSRPCRTTVGPGWPTSACRASGWLDAGAARLANRLVGNRDDGDRGAAVLECLGGGLRVRGGTALTVAVTGARCVPRVDGRAVAFAEPVTVPAGATLSLGALTGGARAYLAVSGGVRVAGRCWARAPPTPCRGWGRRRWPPATSCPSGPPGRSARAGRRPGAPAGPLPAARDRPR